MSEAIEPPSAPALLEIRGVSKAFPGVRALDAVDFTLCAGEIHAVLGENGAGKSTLINVITGVVRKNAGSIHLDGLAINPHAPIEAERAGISAVYQEAPGAANLSVAENIFLGRQPTRFGLIDHSAMNKAAAELLRRFGLTLDVSRELGAYSLAVRQIAAIARAVDLKARVLVLDEPTASLDAAEVAALFLAVRELAAQGVGVIFVTHFLNQVYELTNRICVLRNGRLVGDHATADLPRRQLVDLMLGRSLNEARHVRTPAPTDARIVAKVKGLALKGEAAAFDLEFRAGDVVGAAGLLGSGRSETALLMFGALRADAGAIEIDGRAFRFTSPRQAIAHRFALLPESRKTDGIIGALSIRENIILALQARRGWLAPLTRKQQADIAQRFIALLDIRTPDAEKPIEQLSGGNQQKALIARWLATKPALFLLDEPTRGVDVGAHAEILKLIDAMGQDGMAVYLISSELGELVSLAERVSIMRDRRQADVLEGADVSAENILATIATPSAP